MNVAAQGTSLDTTKTGLQTNRARWATCFLVALITCIVGPPEVQATNLVASDGANGDRFGFAVDIDGKTAVVGSRAPGGSSERDGAVYVFTLDGNTWVQEARLEADKSNEEPQLFGYSVAIDGDTILVGAIDDENRGAPQQGAAYVFVRGDSGWRQEARLTSTDEFAVRFGFSVALDGDTALVGAPGTRSNAGAAYAFTRGDVRWGQESRLVGSRAYIGHQFGWSVALEGRTALVGAPIGRAVYAFVRGAVGWSEVQTIKAAGGALEDFFGHSLAMDSGRAVVASRGSADVFVRGPSTWLHEAVLAASDTDGTANFGYSVAIDAGTVLVGAERDGEFGEETGAAHVFLRVDGEWVGEAKLGASPSELGDRLGFSVAVSGDTALLGAPQHGVRRGPGKVVACARPSQGSFDCIASPFVPPEFEHPEFEVPDGVIKLEGDLEFGNAMAIFEGRAIVAASEAVYVFVQSGKKWELEEVLEPPAEASEGFGKAVAIDGATIFVGAGDVTYVYVRPGEKWHFKQTLYSAGPIAIDGDTSVLGSSVFRYTDSTWSLETNLPTPGINYYFDTAVAFSGETVVIANVGSGVLVYTRLRGIWTLEAELTPRQSFELYVAKVAVSGDTIMVSLPGGITKVYERRGTGWEKESELATSGGLSLRGKTALIGLSLFVLNDGLWQKIRDFNLENIVAEARFGAAMALSEDIVLIGAPGNSTAYVFSLREEESGGGFGCSVLGSRSSSSSGLLLLALCCLAFRRRRRRRTTFHS